MVKYISLLGHKDHGKSTLLGSLLMQTGAATQARIKEAEEYSKRLHKDFEPAFILDSFAEERLQEMTIDTTRAEITYKGLAFSFIDVPGHEELIKNMISGASYGEIAVLLVSAKKDEGIRDQTKRHLFISRMLGIDRLIVAVNKMDTVGYSREIFGSISRDLLKFIERIGFARSNVMFVPISAYKGENLVKRSNRLRWYKGKPLVEELYERVKKEKRPAIREPIVMAQGFIDAEKTLIGGRVITGVVKTGDRLFSLPEGQKFKLKRLIVKGEDAKKAKVGEDVAMGLDKNVESARGSVFTGNKNSLKVGRVLNSLIFVTYPIGEDTRIRFNGNEIKCNALKILKNIDTTTGDYKKEGKPKVLEAVKAQVELKDKIAFDKFERVPELGRFVLFSHNTFAGIGIIE